jgi:hypothetical protein
MGFLIKFLLFFAAIYFLMKAFGSWLSGKRTSQTSSHQSQQRRRREQPKQPETQEDRIIEYQKKTFESSEAEDVDFVEIKDPGKNTR